MRRLPALLLAIVASSACDRTKGDSPHDASTGDASSVAVDAGPRTLPTAKLDPLEVKLHLIDVCYFGALSARHLRRAYLASLGGAEPGPAHVPSFDKASGVDYEGRARRCRPAEKTVPPAVPELDGLATAYAHAAAELGELVEDGSEYYALGRHKQDNFAKGKIYHAKLIAAFNELDTLGAPLAEALIAYAKAHPPSLEGASPERRAASTVLSDVRSLLLAISLDGKKGRASEDHAPLVAKLEASSLAFDAATRGGTENAWTKLRANIVEVVRAAKALPSGRSDGGAGNSGVNDGGPSARSPQLEFELATTSFAEAHHIAIATSLLALANGDASTTR